MIKVYFRSVFTAGILLALSCPAWSVTIELNTGQVITGTIISQDKDSYKIDTGIGFPVTYFIDEIKAIDGAPLSPAAADISQEEPLPEPAATEETLPIPALEPQTPADAAPIADTQTDQVMVSPTDVEHGPETTEIPASEGTSDTVQLEDLVLGELEPAAMEEPMAQVIADEISEMMKKNKAADVQDTPALRSGPAINIQEEPAKDVDEIESELSLKEHPSPFGPTIKPREARGAINRAPITGETAVTGGDNANAIVNAIKNYFDMHKLRLHFAQTSFQKKLPHIKERLQQVPMPVRRSALVVIFCVFLIMYIAVCYPLMNIARQLGKKRSWLIWVPVVQLMYFAYMAGKPLWWSVLWLMPGVNYFLSLLLFVDILRAMNKSFWLIILISIPGVNIFALWYLAISQELQLKVERVEIVSPLPR